MTTLALLWLPILLSAVFVFLVSSVIHMASPMHKGDYKKLPDEAKVLEAMRSARIPPGQYMFPHCGSMKDLGSPETMAKFQQGPIGSMILRPNGMPGMGKALGQWFAWCLVVSAIVAWLTLQARTPGAEPMSVFKMALGSAVLGYAFSHVVEAIWKGLSWVTAIKFMFDGAIYALVTAGTFAWLWPATF